MQSRVGHSCEPFPASPLSQVAFPQGQRDKPCKFHAGEQDPALSAKNQLRDSSGMAFPALTHLLLPAWSLLAPLHSRALMWGCPGLGSRQSFPFSSAGRAAPCPWPGLGAAEGSRAGLGGGWSWDVLGLSL